jgi:asparagine synthetase A
VTIPASEIEVDWEINSMGTRVDDTTLLARQIEVRGNNKKPKK